MSVTASDGKGIWYRKVPLTDDPPAGAVTKVVPKNGKKVEPADVAGEIKSSLFNYQRLCKPVMTDDDYVRLKAEYMARKAVSNLPPPIPSTQVSTAPPLAKVVKPKPKEKKRGNGGKVKRDGYESYNMYSVLTRDDPGDAPQTSQPSSSKVKAPCKKSGKSKVLKGGGKS